jgi:hypothetical protein
MPAQTDVSRHYTHGGLTDAIRDGLASLGKAPGTVTVDDLAPVDEFHIGGRKASEDFLDQLGIAHEAFGGERDGSEDGLSDSGRSLHLPRISAVRPPF